MGKLQNTSKKLDVLFKVFQKITVIGMGVAILAVLSLSIANWFNPNAVIGEDFNIVDVGPVTIELSQNLAPNNETILIYAWIMIFLGMVWAAVLYYAFGIARKILKPMIEGRPFDSDIGYSIKRIAYVILVFGVVQNVGTVIDTISTVRLFELTNFADAANVQSITANFTLNLDFLVLFFILLLLSYVFHYGAELQKLSDETL